MFEDCRKELNKRIGVIMINFDYNYPVPLTQPVYNQITNYIQTFKSVDNNSNNNVLMLFFGIASNYDNFNPEIISSVNKSFVVRYPDIFTLQKVVTVYILYYIYNLFIC